jgi:hypothetical protein
MAKACQTTASKIVLNVRHLLGRIARIDHEEHEGC